MHFNRCEEAYGDFIKLHRGHLCAGNLDGAGGTCVVCIRLTKTELHLR